MDTDNLHQLRGHLEEHGLRVAVTHADRLHVTDPLNEHLTEDSLVGGDCHLTSFNYEIGERGHERDCAVRIAKVLAVACSGGEA